MRVSVATHSGQHLLLSLFFPLNTNHWNGFDLVFHCGFNLHFPSDKLYWASLHVFICQSYVLFDEVSVQTLCVCVFAGSQNTRSHHDKVMRRRPDKQGRSGFQEFRKAAPALTLKDYLCLSDACSIRLLPNFCDMGRRPSPISLQTQNQLKTLINMSPGWWYPIRLSRMKGVFQFRPLCWHSSLLGKCILMHMTAHNTLIINSIKNLITQKTLIGTESFGGWGSPIREHKNIILKVVRFKDLEK